MLDQFISLIDREIEQQGIVSGDVVTKIVTEFDATRKKAQELQRRYEGDVPILTRDISKGQQADFETGYTKGVRVDDKVNHKLANAFDADIIDTKVGYMFGKEIAYDVNSTNVDGNDNEDNESEQKAERLKERASNFNLRNSIGDKDSELGKQATIAGYGGRLLYIKDLEPHVMNIEADKCIVLSETGELSNPKYSLRLFGSVDWANAGGNLQQEAFDNVELYDGETYTTYRRTKDIGSYELHIEPRPHLFAGCPLYGVENNSELMGDAEKVISLIDAYDTTSSDISSEITSQRLAYLVTKGWEIGDDDEERKALREGYIALFGEHDGVSYLTKDVNNSMAENHLDTLSKNIMRFAKTVNFDDEAFGGNVSGVALGYKLLALENKCITSQRKFESALRYQYKLLCSYWNFTGDKLIDTDDYLKLRFSFSRSLPEDVAGAVAMIVDGGGKISNETLLTKSGLVTDANEEIEKLAKQAENDATSVYDAGEEVGLNT